MVFQFRGTCGKVSFSSLHLGTVISTSNSTARAVITRLSGMCFTRLCESLASSSRILIKSGSFMYSFVFTLSLSFCLTWGSAKGLGIPSEGSYRRVLNNKDWAVTSKERQSILCMAFPQSGQNYQNQGQIIDLQVSLKVMSSVIYYKGMSKSTVPLDKK